MSEHEETVLLANRVLDRPSADPDDDLSMLARQFLRAAESRDKLLAAVRRHRDYRGDDRCHLSDGELYSVLPEGDTRPERDTAVTLENCEKFIRCRQQGREYVSPERMVEELRAALLPFGAAASRPRRLLNPMNGEPFPDDAKVGLAIKVSAWKRAAELTGTA